MSLLRYVTRRIILYIIVFFAVVSITWLIPRLLGNPLAIVISRIGVSQAGAAGAELTISYFMQAFSLDKPLHEQYILFLQGLFRGDLGISVWLLGTPVSSIVFKAAVADIILMTPAIIVSWVVGNYLGALAAVHRRLDRIVLPIVYILYSTPFFILALVLQWVLAAQYRLFPLIIQSTIFDQLLTRPTIDNVIAFLYTWALPFLSLFLVSLGGWTLGMRTLMMYELESNYSKFLSMIGFSRSLVSSYAFRYAINPQISGLGIQLGTVVIGSVGIEYIFNYPGLGFYLFNAIINNDPFLLQGAILLLVSMVIVANFVVDMLYVILDPRIRVGVIS